MARPSTLPRSGAATAHGAALPSVPLLEAQQACDAAQDAERGRAQELARAHASWTSERLRADKSARMLEELRGSCTLQAAELRATRAEAARAWVGQRWMAQTVRSERRAEVCIASR